MAQNWEGKIPIPNFDSWQNRVNVGPNRVRVCPNRVNFFASEAFSSYQGAPNNLRKSVTGNHFCYADCLNFVICTVHRAFPLRLLLWLGWDPGRPTSTKEVQNRIILFCANCVSKFTGLFEQISNLRVQIWSSVQFPTTCAPGVRCLDIKKL